jgi:hypothetical protein
MKPGTLPTTAGTLHRLSEISPAPASNTPSTPLAILIYANQIMPANLSAALAGLGFSVMQIDCDLKADSTGLQMGGKSCHPLSTRGTE